MSTIIRAKLAGLVQSERAEVVDRTVVVRDLTRLSRDESALWATIRDLVEAGYTITVEDQGIEIPTTPGWEAVVAMYTASAAGYAQDLAWSAENQRKVKRWLRQLQSASLGRVASEEQTR